MASSTGMGETIFQTQKAPAFHFPLRIEYRFANAARVFAVTHEVTTKDLRFFVPLKARPAMVRVDPEFSLLMELKERKGRDLWLRQLTDDENPIARIRAAAHFGATRRDQDRRTLADALGAEKFWGVQVEIIKQLGNSGGNFLRFQQVHDFVPDGLFQFGQDFRVQTVVERLHEPSQVTRRQLFHQVRLVGCVQANHSIPDLVGLTCLQGGSDFFNEAGGHAIQISIIGLCAVLCGAL